MVVQQIVNILTVGNLKEFTSRSHLSVQKEQQPLALVDRKSRKEDEKRERGKAGCHKQTSDGCLSAAAVLKVSGAN